MKRFFTYMTVLILSGFVFVSTMCDMTYADTDTHFWYAREGASVQLDVTYPLNRHLPTNLNAYLYIQYANRLAERLRLYRERSKAFRIGISIVR